jgi:hypothetical protein
MSRAIQSVLALLLFVPACAVERTGRSKGTEPGATAGNASSAPADSLALVTPRGEIWFSGAREATDASGAPCRERVMEIRQDGRRTPIPLLYTGEAPRLVDDSTIEAAIWLHCRPGNIYRVNLRTGQPVRVR